MAVLVDPAHNLHRVGLNVQAAVGCCENSDLVNQTAFWSSRPSFRHPGRDTSDLGYPISCGKTNVGPRPPPPSFVHSTRVISSAFTRHFDIEKQNSTCLITARLRWRFPSGDAHCRSWLTGTVRLWTRMTRHFQGGRWFAYLLCVIAGFGVCQGQSIGKFKKVQDAHAFITR